MKKLVLTLLLSTVLFTPVVKSQEVRLATVTGQIVDEEQQPIAVGNVVILNPEDSTIITGMVYMEGEFSLAVPSEKDLLLKITSISYMPHFQLINIPYSNQIIGIGSFELRADMLATIEINANQQLMEKEGSNTIVNVANTSLSNAGTALDVMRNAPKIDINRNGQLAILGKGNAIVYLDGQRVASSTLLNGLSSAEIDRIEIIENPTAKYDAEGNGVINVITKSKNVEGYKIGLIQEVGYGKYFRSFFQGNVYFKVKRLMIQGNYGIRPQTLGSRFRQSRELLDESQYFTDNRYHLKNQQLGHNFSLRAAYTLLDKFKVGVNYTGTKNITDKEGNNDRIATVNGTENLNIGTLVLGTTDQSSNTATAYLYYINADKGINFQFNLQYADFKFGRDETIDQNIRESMVDSRLLRQSRNINDIRIYTAQADMQKVISQNLNLEIGAKSTTITNDSRVKLSELDDGASTPLPDFSNSFSYDESITAGYAQLSWNQGGTQTVAGLRGEWTNTNGITDDPEDVQALSRTYFNLFPSVSIKHTLSENLSLSGAYSYRINRPLFQDINPYVLYVDSLVSLRGNPGLLPEYSHAISGEVNYKTWSLALNYTYNNHKVNQIFRSLDESNPNVISFVKENLEYTQLYSATISKSVVYKSYSANFLFAGFYDQHQITDTRGQLNNNKPGYYFQINQFLDLPWRMKLATYIRYTSNRVDGVYTDNPISFINVSWSRKFLNDKLSVQIWANDILDRFKFTGDSNFNNMYMTYLSEGDWRFVKVTLSWNFGKLGAAGFNTKKISQEEVGRINKNQ
ncbi:MAG: outer membrane beta-barrel protein [Reichenbachiella sp.]|uniref:outer membrane beta-barrel protein n=1 Tax=Reichenbachiella sp. TaxID=2184521 RepID=UPI003265BC38